MEKKKVKIWKILLATILVILFIFIIIISRKASILYKIDRKVREYEDNNSNIYIKTNFNFYEHTSQIETFVKDDINKTVLEKTDLEGNKTKIIQITYPNERKLFTENKDNKVMYVYEEKAPVRGYNLERETVASYTVIGNAGYSSNFFETIFNSLVTKIKLVEIDGRKCYELSSLWNTNYLYKNNTNKLLTYVDKDTGLTVKRIEQIIEDGDIKENITTCEYKFNEVTDEDIKEPNALEYKVQE